MATQQASDTDAEADAEAQPSMTQAATTTTQAATTTTQATTTTTQAATQPVGKGGGYAAHRHGGGGTCGDGAGPLSRTDPACNPCAGASGGAQRARASSGRSDGGAGVRQHALRYRCENGKSEREVSVG